MELFYAQTKDGELIFDNKNALFKYLISVDGRKLIVQMGEERHNRTLDQNAYLWGVVYKTVAVSTGHTENELHEIFKRMFLPARFIRYRGREIKLPATTTKLGKSEFSEYIERIKAEAGEMGITIPEPEKI